MKFWMSAPWIEVNEMIEIAKMAEALGFEGIMGADHGFVAQSMVNSYPYSADGVPPITGDYPYPDVFTTITAMAMVTSTLKFSTMVYVLPLRHPVETAKAAANIAQLSNNRLILGIGVGWMKEEFDAYGVDFSRRGKIMDECIQVMRLLWQGDYVAYHGQFFDFDPIKIMPVPDQKTVPLYMGGASQAALQRTAAVGQGWIGAGNTLAEVPGLLANIMALRTEHGREKDPFETIIPLMGERDFMNLEGIEAAKASGMTSTVFGFGHDFNIPLQEKRQRMEQFAKYVMKPLQ